MSVAPPKDFTRLDRFRSGLRVVSLVQRTDKPHICATMDVVVPLGWSFFRVIDWVNDAGHRAPAGVVLKMPSRWKHGP